MYKFNTREDLAKFIRDQVLTTTEAIALLGLSRQRLNTLKKKGKIVPIKDEPVPLFFREDVERLKEELEPKREKYRPYDK